MIHVNMFTDTHSGGALAGCFMNVQEHYRWSIFDMTAVGICCHQQLTKMWMSAWSKLLFDCVYTVNNCCAKKWLGRVC